MNGSVRLNNIRKVDWTQISINMKQYCNYTDLFSLVKLVITGGCSCAACRCGRTGAITEGNLRLFWGFLAYVEKYQKRSVIMSSLFLLLGLNMGITTWWFDETYSFVNGFRFFSSSPSWNCGERNLDTRYNNNIRHQLTISRNKGRKGKNPHQPSRPEIPTVSGQGRSRIFLLINT